MRGSTSEEGRAGYFMVSLRLGFSSDRQIGNRFDLVDCFGCRAQGLKGGGSSPCRLRRLQAAAPLPPRRQWPGRPLLDASRARLSAGNPRSTNCYRGACRRIGHRRCVPSRSANHAVLRAPSARPQTQEGRALHNGERAQVDNRPTQTLLWGFVVKLLLECRDLLGGQHPIPIGIGQYHHHS